MNTTHKRQTPIKTLSELAILADYSYVDTLIPNPKSKANGVDRSPRQVFCGHFVPVDPTPIKDPLYIAHSKSFFKELCFADSLAHNEDFIRMFCGDLSNLPKPLKRLGWATGYALSIYGTEYYEQCPFGSGNGYGDGRAVSIFEGVINNQRYEMQLKGGGKTPYCRGADGRAVLRSSIREFLAGEHMNALGVPTSRSLCLYTSKTEFVKRPWFREDSYSKDPEVMIEEAVAITTRVASSFIRVGQLELFGRRTRKNEHPTAKKELEMIVLHLIFREYDKEIDENLPLEEKIILLATLFRDRLTSLLANWIRVGYCQGNFNSDNCAAGGFTLDYGPFGFIDMFTPRYQPWTGGGDHFSFFNQPQAAKMNFNMFCLSLKPLLQSNPLFVSRLEEIRDSFDEVMEEKMERMWASKLGLHSFEEPLFHELIALMVETKVDYTILFRELSHIPDNITPLTKSFYRDFDEEVLKRWRKWLEDWKSLINISTPKSKEKLSSEMKRINPKYTLKEWFLVDVYKKANSGDFSLITELQEVMTHPYDEQSKEMEEKYYKGKPSHLFNIAGVSHISCSS